MNLSKSLYPRKPTPVTEIDQHPAYQARHAHTHTIEPSDRTMFFALMDFVDRVKKNPERYINGIRWSDFMREFPSITAAADVFDEIERMYVYRLIDSPPRLEPVLSAPESKDKDRFKSSSRCFYIPDGLFEAVKKKAELCRVTNSEVVAKAVAAYGLLDDDPDLRSHVLGREA